MALQQERMFSIDDIYALPDGQRAELIDGRLYMMAPPSSKHQILIAKLTHKILSYIDAKKGDCEVIPSPFAVFLSEDNKNYVEPDISVICDKNKIDDRGCNGAPDWIIEIASPSNQQMDYEIKLFKYRSTQVREYWIVNPMTHIVNVYDFENGKNTRQYSFDETIPVSIYGDLAIRMKDLL